MFLPMRLISKVLINTVILVQITFGLGTQFLSVPSNAIDLAFGSSPLLGKLALNNPALLTAAPQGINMHMSYGSWLSNVSASSFAMASKLNRGNVGFQLRHMGLNDLELRTTTPTDLPLATFGSSAFAIDGGYSRSFGGLKVGASLRYIFVQLHTEKITGYAVAAGAYVNTTDVQHQKTEALAAHASQQDWLDVSQGMNSYLTAANDLSLKVGRLTKKFKHAEGWRRHLHYGFSSKETDPLREFLGKNYLVNQQYERSLGKGN